MIKDEDIKELTLEETFVKIDELMQKLSEEDVPLEESFEMYKDGMTMLNHCKQVIDKVEKKVIELSKADIEE